MRPIQTRFRFGSSLSTDLTLPLTVTRRLIMQKARRHRSSLLRPLASARFQVLFTPIPWVLFTFPSRYCFTIGLPRVFSLAGWCRRIRTGRLQPRPTQDTTMGELAAEYGTLTLYGRPSHAVLLASSSSNVVVLQPQMRRNAAGLGLFAFARHYLRNHSCFLLLSLLRCFSSGGLLTLCV